MTVVKIGKRKRTPVQDEVVMNSSEHKKIKVTPQERNLQQLEKKQNTTPKSRNNIQKKKENTTPKSRNNIQKKTENTIPAPILNFLNQFNLKTKKNEINKQESEVKVVVKESTEKETLKN